MSTRDTLFILKKCYNYFTIWILTITILYYFDIINSFYLELLLLHVFISLISLYIVYIHPRKMDINLGKFSFKLEGISLIIFDILIHHLPLFLLIQKGGENKKNSWLLCLPLIYISIYNPQKIYGVNNLIPTILYSMLLVFYLLF